MAIALRQSAVNGSGPATSCAVALTALNNPSILWVGVNSYKGSGTALTVADSGGHTWTPVAAEYGSSDPLAVVRGWWAPNTGTGTTTVTITGPSGSYFAVVAAEFTGVDMTTPLDGVTPLNNTTSIPTTGGTVATSSVTTNTPNAVLVGLLGGNFSSSNNPSIAVTSGTQIQERETWVTDSFVSTAYEAKSTPGAETITWSVAAYTGSASSFVSQVFALRPAVGSQTASLPASQSAGNLTGWTNPAPGPYAYWQYDTGLAGARTNGVTGEHAGYIFHGIPTTADYHLSGWVRTTETSGQGAIRFCLWDTGNNGYTYFVGNSHHIYPVAAGVTGTDIANWDKASGDYEWCYVDFIFNATTNIFSVYEDGVLMGTTPHTTYKANNKQVLLVTGYSATAPTNEAAWRDITLSDVIHSVGPGVLDDFNRSNGALGANWTAVAGTALQIASNKAVSNIAGYGVSNYTGEFFEDDQIAEVEVTLGTGYSGGGVSVRNQSGSESGYIGVWESGSGGNYQIFHVPTYATVGTGVTGVGSSGTRLLRLEVVGTTLSLYVNGVLQITGTHSGYTSGAPAIRAFSGGSVTTLDNFRAGPIGPPPPAEIELIQSNGAEDKVNTFDSPLTPGSTLIAICSAWNEDITGCTDTDGHTWSPMTASAVANGTDRIRGFWAENTGTATPTVTFTTSSGYCVSSVAEFSGIDNTVGLDVTSVTNTGVTSNASSGNITPVTAGALLIGAMQISFDGAIEPEAGFTELYEHNNYSAITTLDVAYKVQTSIATEDIDWTNVNFGNWCAFVAAFRPAAGGGTPDPDPQTWVGSDLSATVSVTSGSFIPGPRTWIGNALSVIATPQPGAFSGPQTWVGSALQTNATFTSGTFTPGVSTWAGGALQLTATPSSGAFVPGTVTWSGNSYQLAITLTSGSFIPGVSTWVGNACQIAATITSGAFSPGVSTWVGNSLPIASTFASGAFVPGTATWSGNSLQTTSTLTSNPFIPGGVTWTGNSVQTTLTLTSGSFTPGMATWAGSSLNVATELTSGVFVASGGPQTWIGNDLPSAASFLSGPFSPSVVTWAGNLLTIQIALTSGALTPGTTIWPGNELLAGASFESGSFIPGGITWSGSVLPLSTSLISGIWTIAASPQTWIGNGIDVQVTFSAGIFGKTWIGNSISTSTEFLSGLFVPLITSWNGNELQAQTQITSGVFIPGLATWTGNVLEIQAILQSGHLIIVSGSHVYRSPILMAAVFLGNGERASLFNGDGIAIQ